LLPIGKVNAKYSKKKKKSKKERERRKKEYVMRTNFISFWLDLFYLKKIISFDSDIGLRQKWWRWKAYLEGYKFVFHENFIIPTFTRQKLSFCIIYTA
jgi:hypothetical protein